MSAHEHLSDDVLIDALYGLADRPGLDAHGRECPACAARWNVLLEKRAAITSPLAVSAAELASERRKIFHAIEHPSRLRWAAPALAAAACLAVIGVFVHHPAAPPRPAPVEVSDTQLFSDVYSIEQSFEPSAAASLGTLFESDDASSDDASQGVNPSQSVNQ